MRSFVRCRQLVLLSSCLLAACADAGDDADTTVVQSAITINTSAVYNMVGVQSNKCVDVVGGSTANGVRLDITTCNGTTRMQWRAESMGSGFYRMRNLNSNLCMDVNGASMSNGAAVIQWTCGTGTNQQWSFTDLSSGIERLTARHSGKVLDVVGQGTADGTLLQQYTSSGGTSQQFRMPFGTLKDAAASTGRLVGAAIGSGHLSETAYTNAAKGDFNYATPENEMKWDATEPTQGQFTFSGGDAIVNFASTNGMKVKGHTLVWHSQLPAWVSNLTSASAVQSAMTNHITQVMTHFKGKVVAWDVVNEAWDDGATPALRTDVFYNYLGASYIDLAFQTARAADSSVKLYYNDYSTEGIAAKANAVYTMVQSMKSRGIPIDGVGLQMHTGPTNSWPTIADLTSNIQRLAALGVEVVISEMDVPICTSDLATQRTRYHDIAAACVAQSACKAFTTWGVTDKYSWLNGRSCTSPQPLLFDANFAKKLAFSGVLDALNSR